MKHALPHRDGLSQRTATAVRVEMARQDVSPAELASKLGVDPRVLHRRLKCQSAWTLDWLEAVTEALNVSPRQLLSGESDVDAA